MKRIYVALALLGVTLISMGSCWADDGSGRKHITGTVTRIEKITTTQSGNADQSVSQMGQMFGILGVLVAEVLSIEQFGYSIYYVKAGDAPAFEVSSRKGFSEGDCVVVSFPESMGDTPHIGIDADVSITGGSGCLPTPLSLKLSSLSSLEVSIPKGTGWQILGSTPGTISFAKKGAASNETFVAFISAFPLSSTKDSDEFVSLVRNGVEKDTSPDRYTTVEANFEYTESRGYPCVHVKGVTEDKQAKTGFFSRGTLTLQSDSFYCRYPQQPDLGFVIAYTHRGEDIYLGLDLEAEEFFQGVRVP